MKRFFLSVRTLGVLTTAAAVLALSGCVVAPLPHRVYGGPPAVIVKPGYGYGYDRGGPPRRWDRHDRHDHYGHDRDGRY